MLGLNVTEGRLLGMITGIGIFIAAYVWADLVTRNRPWRRYRNITITLRTVYVLRLVLSVILPAGMVVDMFTGMLAIVAVTSIGQFEGNAGFGYLSTVFTTLIQGVLLNILLMVLALCIYPIVRVTGRTRVRATGRTRDNRKQTKRSSDDQTPLDASSESLDNPLLSSSDSSSSEPSLR